MRPAVFLDRDGTLIEEVGYLDRLDRLSIFPWSAEAVRRLSAGGFRIVVVTNQSGVARGLFAESFVEEVHRVLDERLEAAGARIDAYYYCPHHPDGDLPEYRRDCECRKPRPGLIRRAARELSIDLSRSYVVGDRWLDVELAQAVGACGILVRSGYWSEEAATPEQDVTAAAVLPDLLAAAAWILQRAQ